MQGRGRRRRLESFQRGGLVAESSKHALAQRADLRLPRAQLRGEQPVPQRVRVRVVQATTPERWRECRHVDARDGATRFRTRKVEVQFLSGCSLPAE